jgi:GMP synthase (glutamine-hydrolysing)
MQLMAYELGGAVAPNDHREYGPAELQVLEPYGIFGRVSPVTRVWMSHGDRVEALPPASIRWLRARIRRWPRSATHRV